MNENTFVSSISTSKNFEGKFKCPFDDCDRFFSSVKKANEHAIHRNCKSKMVQGKSTEERKELVNKIHTEERLKANIPVSADTKQYVACPCGVPVRIDNRKVHIQSNVHKAWWDPLKGRIALRLANIGLAHVHCKSILNDIVDGAFKIATSLPEENTLDAEIFKSMQKLDKLAKDMNVSIEGIIELFLSLSGDMNDLDRYLEGNKVNLWSKREDEAIKYPHSDKICYDKLLKSEGINGIEKRLSFLPRAKNLERCLHNAYHKIKMFSSSQAEDLKEQIPIPSKDQQQEEIIEISDSEEISDKPIEVEPDVVMKIPDTSLMQWLYVNGDTKNVDLTKINGKGTKRISKLCDDEVIPLPDPSKKVPQKLCLNTFALYEEPKIISLEEEKLPSSKPIPKEMTDEQCQTWLKAISLPINERFTPAANERFMNQDPTADMITERNKRFRKTQNNYVGYRRRKLELEEKAKEWEIKDRKRLEQYDFS